MTEDHLVRHCAPTLAGIKTGSMFACPYASKESVQAAVQSLNRRLRKKGLRVLPLRFSEERALIYLYRPDQLAKDLSDSTAAEILRGHGYNPERCEDCVIHLCSRLREQQDFPHEIGLFLGYPPEDVCGFILNNACNCKCIGCWKVYGDVEAARKKFALYKKCTRVYCDQWARKKDFERLTVAS